MSDQQPSYFSIIPATVRYDKTLPPAAKLLYGEITALTSMKGYCWSSNAYFADLYAVHKNTISSWISMLEKAGHIKVEPQTLTQERRITLRENVEGVREKIDTPTQNPEYPSTKSLIPLNENVDRINTVSNTEINTVNNTEKEELARANAALSAQVEVMVVQVATLVSTVEEIKKEKAPHTGARRAKPPDPPPEPLIYPFDTEEFIRIWELLMTQPAHLKKTHTQRQAILKLLSDFDEQFAIDLIMKAIAGGYQGVVFSDTKESYQRYLKQKNGQHTNGHRDKSNHDALAAFDAELTAKISKAGGFN